MVRIVKFKFQEYSTCNHMPVTDFTCIKRKIEKEGNVLNKYIFPNENRDYELPNKITTWPFIIHKIKR